MSCFKNIDFCINDYLSLSWLKGSTPEERQEQFVVFVIKNSKYIFDDIVRIVSSEEDDYVEYKALPVQHCSKVEFLTNEE